MSDTKFKYDWHDCHFILVVKPLYDGGCGRPITIAVLQMVADETGLIRYVLRDRPAGETPQTIGSYLLGQLRRTAAKRLDVPVTKAVISVPAEFDDEQREATKQAAQLAGNTG